jgi:hypothetical protein
MMVALALSAAYMAYLMFAHEPMPMTDEQRADAAYEMRAGRMQN